MRRISRDTMTRALAARDALRTLLQDHPDVTGFGVGYRERRGRLVQTCCVRVHVARKFPLEALPPDLVIPPDINGMPVDVIESDFAGHAAPNPGGYVDPLAGGMMIASARRFAGGQEIGTGGCTVMDAQGRSLLLSNWHVLYGSTGHDGDTVVQPRPSGSFNDIGVTIKGIISSRVDAAVVELRPGRSASDTVLGIPGAVLSQSVAWPGMKVRKSGANGLGWGIIAAIYDGPALIDGTVRPFEQQFDIREVGGKPFNCSKGDSGALWLREDNLTIVGLHFAGQADRALANPIGDVVTELEAAGVSLLL